MGLNFELLDALGQVAKGEWRFVQRRRDVVLLVRQRVLGCCSLRGWGASGRLGPAVAPYTCNRTWKARIVGLSAHTDGHNSCG